MRRDSSRGRLSMHACFAAGLLLSLGSARAAPPPPPGGHHPLTFGGDNRAGYPALTPTDAAEPVVDALSSRLTVKIHPNPFQGSTTIRLALRAGQQARFVIYDLAGRRVREFVQAAPRSGWQELLWDGHDEHGRGLPAGAYVYRVEMGDQVATGKLVLLH